MYNKTLGEKIFDNLNVFFMIMLSLMMLYPFWYQLCVSLSDPLKVAGGGVFFIPDGFSADAYKIVLKSRYLWKGFGNSLFVVIFGTLSSVVTISLTAYALSKQTLPGRTLITMLIVFTMFFSGGLIPTYLVVKATGLLNSRWSMIVPTMISAYQMVIVRNFFQNLPDALEESAKIDGASFYTIFFRIIIPLSLPVLATISLWQMVAHWNDFRKCLIYINDRNKYVAQMILREIVQVEQYAEMDVDNTNTTMRSTPETIKAASVMVISTPIICVYPFLQKYFVKGIMIGSLKG